MEGEFRNTFILHNMSRVREVGSGSGFREVGSGRGFREVGSGRGFGKRVPRSRFGKWTGSGAQGC